MFLRTKGGSPSLAWEMFALLKVAASGYHHWERGFKHP